MTAVLEPAETQTAVFAPCGPPSDDPVTVAPVHCGTVMALGYVPSGPRLPWAMEEPAQAEWACRCGFRMAAATTEATDPLRAVRLMSARLETVQWELDHAQELLAEAVRKAARFGATPGALREAANMEEAELEALL